MDPSAAGRPSRPEQSCIGRAQQILASSAAGRRSGDESQVSTLNTRLRRANSASELFKVVASEGMLVDSQAQEYRSCGKVVRRRCGAM